MNNWKNILSLDALYILLYSIAATYLYFSTGRTAHPLVIALIGLFFTAVLTAYLVLRPEQAAVRFGKTHTKPLEVYYAPQKETTRTYQPRAIARGLENASWLRTDVDLNRLDADDDYHSS